MAETSSFGTIGENNRSNHYESSNGSVTVRVGPDVSAGFGLSTTNGRASIGDLQHTSSTSRRGRIEGRLRGGSEPTLTARTTNGDVRLRSAEAE